MGMSVWPRVSRGLGWMGIALGAVLLLSAPVAIAQGKIFLHKDRKGVRTFSDQKLPSSHFTYIGQYGRPTATLSCQGLTADSLKTREQKYEPLIAGHAKSYGIEPALIKAVMRVESCFDSKAVSRVGARGLMQLMPETAALLGVGDSFNPDQNIRGGVQYLDMMLDRFGQNQDLALAAYNAGPEAVRKHQGVPPYTETKDYIRRVSAQYRKYRQLVEGTLQPTALLSKQ